MGLNRSGRRWSWALALVAILTGSVAAAIRLVSAAHGHGLAASDARAVWLLGLVAAVAAIGALILFFRRP